MASSIDPGLTQMDFNRVSTPSSTQFLAQAQPRADFTELPSSFKLPPTPTAPPGLPSSFENEPEFVVKEVPEGVVLIQEYDDKVHKNLTYYSSDSIEFVLSDGTPSDVAVYTNEGRIRTFSAGALVPSADLREGDRIYFRQQVKDRTQETVIEAQEESVSGKSAPDKLIAAAAASIDHVDDAIQAEVRQLLQPEALAVMAGVIATWAGLHAVGGPVALAADGVLIGAASVGLGLEAIQAGKELFAYVAKASQAETPEQIEEAAQHFATFVGIVGVEVVTTLVGVKAAKLVDDLTDIAKANFDELAKLPGATKQKIGELWKVGDDLLGSAANKLGLDDLAQNAGRKLDELAQRLFPQPQPAGVGRGDLGLNEPLQIKTGPGQGSGSKAQQSVVQRAVDEIGNVYGPKQAKITQESLDLLAESSALGPQGAALAGERLKSLSTQTLPRLQESLEKLQGLLSKATDVQKRHPAYSQLANKVKASVNKVKDLKPQDLVGALRDEVDLPVRKPWKPRQGVQTYSHQNEVEEAINNFSFVNEDTGKATGLYERIGQFRESSVYNGGQQGPGLKDEIPEGQLSNLQKELDSTIEKIKEFRKPATYQRHSSLGPQQIPPSSSPLEQNNSYGQLLAAQQFVDQHLRTKPQLPSNQEVDDLLATLSPRRAKLQQLQQVKQIATVELEQLEQRGERSIILNPLGYTDRQHDQAFNVWQRASDAVYGQTRENDYYESRVKEYAQTIRSHKEWEQQPETNQMKQIQQLFAQPELQSQLAFAQQSNTFFDQSMEAAATLDQPPISPDNVRAMQAAFLTEGNLPSEEQMATLAAMTDQHQELLTQQAAATPDLGALGA